MENSIIGSDNFETIEAIFFYFLVYAFFGWLLENSYSLFTKQNFFKPNFLKGPFKPMYGFAPILIVLLTNKNTHWSVLILLCFFIPTIIEYISGMMLEKLFRQRYWDYSDVPLQLHGHICLPFSLCWIFLSIACLKWIHPAISSFYLDFSHFLRHLYPAIICYFLAELIFAVRRHSLQNTPINDTTN